MKTNPRPSISGMDGDYFLNNKNKQHEINNNLSDGGNAFSNYHPPSCAK